MKVLVTFENSERTRASIVLVPGRLARLFGAQSRTGIAMRAMTSYSAAWVWETTLRDVDADVGRRRGAERINDEAGEDE